MRFLVGFLFFCIGISAVIDAAEECYACDRDGCNDAFNSNNPGVVTITAEDGWCVKTSGKVLGENGVTVRGPATREACVSNDCDRLRYQNNDFVFCCCNKNLCNAASPLNIGRSTTIISFCLSILLALVLIN